MGHPVGRGGFRAGVMTARSSFLVQIQNQHSHLRMQLRSEKGESELTVTHGPKEIPRENAPLSWVSPLLPGEDTCIANISPTRLW
jgi:hypothetical protein